MLFPWKPKKEESWIRVEGGSISVSHEYVVTSPQFKAMQEYIKKLTSVITLDTKIDK